MTLDEFRKNAITFFERRDMPDVLSQGLGNGSLALKIRIEADKHLELLLSEKATGREICAVIGNLHLGKEFGISAMEFEFRGEGYKDFATPMFQRVIAGMHDMGASFVASADILDKRASTFFTQSGFDFLNLSSGTFERRLTHQRVSRLRRKFRLPKVGSTGIPRILAQETSGEVGDNFPDNNIKSVAVLLFRKKSLRRRAFKALGLT